MSRLAGALLVLLALTVLAGCSGGDEPGAEPPVSSPTPTPTAVVPPPPVPANRACYRLDYDAALEATTAADPVDCGERATAMTFFVGEPGRVVQARVAEECPRRLPAFIGGSSEDQRLSMLRPVWFTPTPEELDAGARWYRCDVVALAADGELAPLSGKIAGTLNRPTGRDYYGMCGTAEPGTPAFDRVICSRKHTWRAIQVVPVPGSTYPGVAAVRAAGEEPCRDAGAAVADSALDYQWGYEWPTAEQWRAGQHYGRCWAPD